MITDDEIMRLFELADPARDDDGVRLVDAAGYLDALRTRSYDMQLIDTPEAPTKTPRDNRWILAAIVAAAIVLIVAGALILSRDDGDQVPATPQTTVAPPEPTIPVEQGEAMSADQAIALVRSYFDALNAHDADAALGFLADTATVPSWSQGRAQPTLIGSPDTFRVENESAAATNTQMLLGDCTTVGADGPGFSVRCAFETQDLRSDQLGLGPYGGSSVDVAVADGKIASIATTDMTSDPTEADRWVRQVWDPFGAWINAQHPDDAAVMFADDTPNAASIALWDLHTREYVQLRLAAEQAATQFLEAFGAFDAQAAGAYLADGASTERIVTEDVQDYTEAIELYQALGYRQELGACQQVNATATALSVQCPFSYDLMGSQDMGLGPFEGSRFVVTVDSATGKITQVVNVWNDTNFMREVGTPFIDWVTATYPDAEAVMSVNGSPALTSESLALWALYRDEYVQHVLASPPATTAP